MENARVTSTQAESSVSNAEISIANTVHLADRINQHHTAAVKHAESALEHARAAGELLLEAKDGCKHGEWLDWIAANFAGSEKTAHNYMRVARRWQQIMATAKPQRVTDLSLREALRLDRYGYARRSYQGVMVEEHECKAMNAIDKLHGIKPREADWLERISEDREVLGWDYAKAAKAVELLLSMGERIVLPDDWGDSGRPSLLTFDVVAGSAQERGEGAPAHTSARRYAITPRGRQDRQVRGAHRAHAVPGDARTRGDAGAETRETSTLGETGGAWYGAVCFGVFMVISGVLGCPPAIQLFSV